MRDSVDHLPELELIRLLDGEMTVEEKAQAASHVEECSHCSLRMDEIARIGEELKEVDGHSRAIPADALGSRVSLAARLAEVRRQETGSAWEHVARWMRARMTPSFGYGALAAAAIVAVLFGAPNLHRSVAEISESLPNRALTPGMTRPVSVEEVCAEGDDDLDPEVPASRQEAVFREYGIAMDHSAQDFQVDYLISPQLGGTDDVRNLWPQSYKETAWNARAKDALERHLYQMVCDRKIDLAEAQREIATDWISAYQKYFRTSRPG